MVLLHGVVVDGSVALLSIVDALSLDRGPAESTSGDERGVVALPAAGVPALEITTLPHWRKRKRERKEKRKEKGGRH